MCAPNQGHSIVQMMNGKSVDRVLVVLVARSVGHSTLNLITYQSDGWYPAIIPAGPADYLLRVP